ADICRLDISKEKLERAPGFDKDHWPSMADARWAAELHGYYDVVPYLRKTERSAGLRIRPRTRPSSLIRLHRIVTGPLKRSVSVVPARGISPLAVESCAVR